MIELELSYKKSTKGTFVYENKDSFIPTIYIKRPAFDEPPKTIKLVVTYED